jgi:hypothetical protein
VAAYTILRSSGSTAAPGARGNMATRTPPGTNTATGQYSLPSWLDDLAIGPAAATAQD